MSDELKRKFRDLLIECYRPSDQLLEEDLPKFYALLAQSYQSGYAAAVGDAVAAVKVPECNCKHAREVTKAHRTAIEALGSKK